MADWGCVPLVVAKLGNLLKSEAVETEGIFRKVGSQRRMKLLQSAFESPPDYGRRLQWGNESFTVHDAACVLRRYITSLPEPLVPVQLWESFRTVVADQHAPPLQPIGSYARSDNVASASLASAERWAAASAAAGGHAMAPSRSNLSYSTRPSSAGGPASAPASQTQPRTHSTASAATINTNPREALERFHVLIQRCPEPNRHLLLYLLDLLSAFAQKSAVNLMTASNLAVIFQPGFFYHPSLLTKPEEHQLAVRALEFLIQNQAFFSMGSVPLAPHAPAHRANTEPGSSSGPPGDPGGPSGPGDRATLTGLSPGLPAAARGATAAGGSAAQPSVPTSTLTGSASKSTSPHTAAQHTPSRSYSAPTPPIVLVVSSPPPERTPLPDGTPWTPRTAPLAVPARGHMLAPVRSIEAEAPQLVHPVGPLPRAKPKSRTQPGPRSATPTGGTPRPGLAASLAVSAQAQALGAGTATMSAAAGSAPSWRGVRRCASAHQLRSARVRRMEEAGPLRAVAASRGAGPATTTSSTGGAGDATARRPASGLHRRSTAPSRLGSRLGRGASSRPARPLSTILQTSSPPSAAPSLAPPQASAPNATPAPPPSPLPATPASAPVPAPAPAPVSAAALTPTRASVPFSAGPGLKPPRESSLLSLSPRAGEMKDEPSRTYKKSWRGAFSLSRSIAALTPAISQNGGDHGSTKSWTRRRNLKSSTIHAASSTLAVPTPSEKAMMLRPSGSSPGIGGRGFSGGTTTTRTRITNTPLSRVGSSLVAPRRIGLLSVTDLHSSTQLHHGSTYAAERDGGMGSTSKSQPKTMTAYPAGPTRSPSTRSARSTRSTRSATRSTRGQVHSMSVAVRA